MRVTSFAPRSRAGATARWIGIAAFLLYAVSGGGRIVGSDEVTMLELARAMLRGGIAVPEGATLEGPDGRHYTKNAAAQAVAALPLVAAGVAAARAARLSPARQALAVRFVASFFNAIVTAVLLALFYGFARRLGVRPRRALAGTLLLGLTTPLWVYAKSFMAEPLQALGLLLALEGYAGAGGAGAAGDPGAAPVSAGSARAAFLGTLLAVSAKLSMVWLVAGIGVALAGRPLKAWIAPVLGGAAALAGHALYDFARFHTPFETGYGAQATWAAYTTPLLTGLYGLLISSGKGVLWFAPALWLAVVHWRAWAQAGRGPGPLPAPAGRGGFWSRLGTASPARRAGWGACGAAAMALWLYGRFQHWAGDGSFGPRYLIPILPPAFLLVTLVLEHGPRSARRLAVLLGALGFLVQAGGVAIYFGAQMREAGDYPYTLPLDDPRFMSDSHFNPRFTPIAGHWKLLLRNAGEHLRGREPKLEIGGDAGAPATAADTSRIASTAARLGIAAEGQRELLHALDFWWLYLGYAEFPKGAVRGAAAALGLAALAAAWQAWRAACAEAGA